MAKASIAYEHWLQQETNWPSASKQEAVAIEDMPYSYVDNAMKKLVTWGLDPSLAPIGDITRTPLYRALAKRLHQLEGQQVMDEPTITLESRPVLPSTIHLALTSADPDWRQWNPIDLAAHVASHLNGDPL